MTRHAGRLLSLVLCAASVACTTHPVRLDNIENVHYDPTRPTEVKSEACGTMLLFAFIPVKVRSRQLRAELAIQNQANGGVLTNVRVQERWLWILFGTLLCTEISATAYPRVP